jgi:hypothetical protein
LFLSSAIEIRISSKQDSKILFIPKHEYLYRCEYAY